MLWSVHEPSRVVVEGQNPTRYLDARQLLWQQLLQPVVMLLRIPRASRRVILRLPDPGIIRVCAESMYSDNATRLVMITTIVIIINTTVLTRANTYSTTALLSICKTCIGYSARGGAPWDVSDAFEGPASNSLSIPWSIAPTIIAISKRASPWLVILV